MKDSEGTAQDILERAADLDPYEIAQNMEFVNEILAKAHIASNNGSA